MGAIARGPSAGRGFQGPGVDDGASIRDIWDGVAKFGVGLAWGNEGECYVACDFLIEVVAGPKAAGGVKIYTAPWSVIG